MTILASVLPQNDNELNTLIAQMNASYGRYFSLEVSESRSNKLRDCICEGLGFTNGAYQQLQKYWETKTEQFAVYTRYVNSVSYQFFDALYMSGIRDPNSSESVVASISSVVMVSQALRSKVLDTLATLSRTSEKVHKNERGWSYDDYQGLASSYVAYADMKYPIYVGAIVIGFAKTADYAVLVGGAIHGAMIELSDFSWADPVKSTERFLRYAMPVNDSVKEVMWQWSAYLRTKAVDSVKLPKYLFLRASNESEGVVLPFSEIEFYRSKIVCTSAAYGSVTLDYDADKDQYVLREVGVGFDFVIAYSVTEPLRVQSNNVKVSDAIYSEIEPVRVVSSNITVSDILFSRVEILNNKLESMPVNEDVDSMQSYDVPVDGALIVR